jgi:hypothetical protein
VGGAEHAITSIPDLRIIERDFEKPEQGNQQESFEGFNRHLSGEAGVPFFSISGAEFVEMFVGVGLLERHRDIHRFVKALNAFRQRRDVIVEGTALSLNQLLTRARIEWHGVTLKRPDWSDHSHSLAFTVQSLRARFLLHGMLNAYWEPLTFELPPVPSECSQACRRCIDTAPEPPDDICP